MMLSSYDLKSFSCSHTQQTFQIPYSPNKGSIFHHRTSKRYKNKNNHIAGSISTTTEKNYSINTEFQKHLLDNKDVDQLIADYNFPIPSDVLIDKAKKFVLSQVENEKAIMDVNLMSEDFVFTGSVVGPLSKKTLSDVLGSFDVLQLVPDLSQNFHNFTIDPFQPNRVWMFNTSRGTNTGPLPGGRPPTGKRYIAAPEMQSVTFNEQGLVCKYTVGYVLDRTVGNTGGVGGLFGLFYAIGIPLPIPEAQPYKKSWQRSIFESLQLLTSWFNNNKK
eukprot:TRINITY_DN6983_c0_g1_i5.p2 TRINITY_DN6983_c0_g1~~TRINITY_DN6983_c0_g1_i5.p2  ORF type:complete len:275 (+),score=18.97 TRINITY_DN6983_c0_g1_i5:144-968(+)